MNWVDIEYKVRKCYSLDLAFGRVTNEEGWARPVNAKSWTSRGDWRIVDKVGPSVVHTSQLRVRELAGEFRAATEPDSLLAKAQLKLVEFQGQPADRRNPN